MVFQALHQRPWVRRALIPGIWLFYAVVMAGQTYFAYMREGKTIPLFTWAIGPALIYSVTYLALTPVVLFLARRYPLERPHRSRNISIHVVSSIVLALVQRLAADTGTVLLRTAPEFQFKWMSVFQMVVGFFDYGVLIYWTILLIYQALDYSHRIQEERVRTSQLENQLTQARLDALRAQLRPHFLFNTLNSISALLDENPRAADKMIARLGDFLRLTLENAGEPLVPLGRDLKSLKTYVAIEQTRFEGNLELEVEAEPCTLEAMVPSFLWQPIVENAIHHGIETSGGLGRITVRACSRNGSLQLQVQDNGTGLVQGSGNEALKREGLGLRNTRAILENLYGSNYRLELTNVPEGGALVTLVTPFVRLQDHERRNPHDGGGRRGSRQEENSPSARGRS